MAKSKWFRIAVEGATTDGRVIERDWIAQMAETYDPATYTARINCEHLKGFSPEAPFNAYGSVLALKAEEVTLKLDGKDEKRLALFAQIDANDQLVAINRKGQKIFTSMEVSPVFADTKKAYLVGLAVTDSPASLGTEALSFAALKPTWDARKLNKDNLFSAAEETSFELDQAEEQTGLIANFMAALTNVLGKKEEPVAPPVQQPANDNAFDPTAFATDLGKAFTPLLEGFAKTTNDAIAKVANDVADLRKGLENEAAGGAFNRQPATGGTTAAFATDC